jgi:lambda repressor-like predicted transcriptional regulator
MPGKPHRSPTQRAADAATIAALRLQGWMQADIAREVGLSPATVKRELRKLETQWREQASEDLAAVKARELMKLERMEREAFRQWERSKRAHRKVVKDGETTRKEVTGQTGDPRYLQTVVTIMDRRNRLLGLDMPTKIAPTTPDGSQGLDLREREAIFDLSQLSYDEAVALRTLSEKARARAAPAEATPAGGSP